MVRFSAKIACALIVSAGVSATALAQNPSAGTTPPVTKPATTTTTEVDDQQIRSFVLALVEIEKIHDRYQPRFEAAAAEQRPAIEEEAKARMAAAVQAQGLEPQTFNAIAAAAQEDPAMREKIQAEAAKIQPATPAGR